MTTSEIPDQILNAHRLFLVGQSAHLRGEYNLAYSRYQESLAYFKRTYASNPAVHPSVMWQMEMRIIENYLDRLPEQVALDGTMHYSPVEESITEHIQQMRHTLPLQSDWGALQGLTQAKDELTDIVLTPLRHSEGWALNSDPPRRVLLYGPPGCGKTLLVKQLVALSGLPVYLATPDKLLSKWVGESEKAVVALFNQAYQEPNGCIVFFDEFDVLAGTPASNSDINQKVRAQLLTALSGFEERTPNKVVVIAATNRPDLLDGAVIRRFNSRLLISTPTVQTIQQIVTSIFQKANVVFDWSSSYWQNLFISLRGYTADEIAKFVNKTIWKHHEAIIDQNDMFENAIKGYMQTIIQQLTPYYCTFSSVEPQTFRFLDGQFGFPKTPQPEQDWEKEFLQRKNQLIHQHPNPRLIYQRKAEQRL